MALHDTCADIAALLIPVPAPDDDGPTAAAAEAAWGERGELAEALRASWDGEDADPLLSTLDSLRRQRLRLEGQMRLLIAYGRRFTHPRPYKLADLAAATGMSISGTRTAYDADEVQEAAGILQRPPASSDS